MVKNRERFVWVGLTAFVLVFLAAFAFSPALTAESQTDDTQKYLDLFDRVFRSIENNYVEKTDAEKLFGAAMKGIFDSLNDPHSYYLTSNETRDLTDITEGEFGGVGLIISKPPLPSDPANAKPLPDTKTEPPYVEVVSPIRGSPAFKAGVSAGDRITKIEEESTVGMTIDEVVNKLRGAPGTKVTVTILRGSDITRNVELERAIIQVPDVKFAMIPGGIAYLRIIQYTAFTPDKVMEAINYFRANSYKSLIIDERGNPGGRLSAVVEIADDFLSSGTIVSTRSRVASENQIFSAHPDAAVPDSIPIIVLIDKGSASAAEILAGALHDNHRALLVGETSFGKGSVQQVFFLPGGDGAYKLTTARYYTPSGINIDKIGITPDKVIKEPDLTKAEQDSLKILVEDNAFTNFVRENPNASAAAIDTFVAKLRGSGIVLGDTLLKQLIRNEQDRMMTDPPAYDLDFDPVLREAARLFTSGEYPPAGR